MTNCEIDGCKKPAKYGTYRFNPDGSKTWLRVCIAHEIQIGDANERQLSTNAES